MRPITKWSRILTVLLVLLAPLGLATPARAAAQAEGCVEYDEQGRCILWFDGQVYLGSGNHLPVVGSEPPLKADEFFEYVLTSTCADGGKPPGNKAYNCDKFKNTCGTPTSGPAWKGRYEIWRRTFRKGAPGLMPDDTWGPVSDWENKGEFCLGKDEGTIHQYSGDYGPMDLNQPWLTYVASYPGGKLVMQPPGGVGVVGMRTNFYTREPGTIIYSHYHLNNAITQLRVEPRFYRWTFGDDTPELRTQSAGKPYPDGDVTHIYTERKTYQPKVAIEFQRYLRAANGTWSTTELLHDSQAGVPITMRMVEIRAYLSFPGLS